MTEGYSPQATMVSKTLLMTFAAGVVIGFLIGWGAATSRTSPPETPDAPLADHAPQELDPAPVEPDPAPAELPAAPVAADARPLPRFEPDVDGLWPLEHVFAGVSGVKADVATLEWLNEFKPGGVVLRPENMRDPLQVASLVLQIKQAVGLGTTLSDPPVILFADSESDLPRLLEGDAAAVSLASISTETAEAAAARALAGRQAGVAGILGPALEAGIEAGALDGAGIAAMQARAAAISRDGVAYASRLRAGGMLPVARLLPGARIAREEDGVWRIPAEPMDALAASLQPFKAAVDAGVPGLLVGHVAVPGIDADRPNRPASLSPKLIQLLVRDDWGYDGVILADDINRHPMTRDLPPEEVVLKALVSGCDAVILLDPAPDQLRAIGETFAQLAQRSDFPISAIQASKRRLAAWREFLKQPVSAAGPARIAAAPEAKPVDTPPDSSETGETKAEDESPPTATGADAQPELAPESPEPESPESEQTESEQTESEQTESEQTESDQTESAPGETQAPSAPTVAAPGAPAPVSVPEPFIEHTIAQGETLTAIARRYGVSLNDLMAWNGLADGNIKYGRKLKVHVKDQATAPEAPEPEASPEPEPTPAPEKSPQAEPESVPSPTPEAGADAAAEPDPSATADEPAAPEMEPEAAAPSGEESAAAAPRTVESVVTLDAVEAGAPDDAPRAPGLPPQPPDTTRREHAVQPGESLASIADEYGVTEADIRAWNALADGAIAPDTLPALVLYLPVAAPDAEDAEPAPPATPEPVEATPAPAATEFTVYEVVAGDNLRRIAMRFGVTQKAIMELNNLKIADHVVIGWKLKIPKPEGAAPP
ncbi:MAG: LysM peptidoglycan-binding domain-containing protein [Candidatus Hydrogenedentes bacterium]|nr:LysM peptidoglycan-binding domain-containing protein [Candidatus Hydrogenedentota bacterium]